MGTLQAQKEPFVLISIEDFCFPYFKWIFTRKDWKPRNLQNKTNFWHKNHPTLFAEEFSKKRKFLQEYHFFPHGPWHLRRQVTGTAKLARKLSISKDQTLYDTFPHWMNNEWSISWIFEESYNSDVTCNIRGIFCNAAVGINYSLDVSLNLLRQMSLPVIFS